MENQITSLLFPPKNTESKFRDMKPAHVAIRTTEYADVIEWYKDNLDFRLIHEWTAGEMQLAFIAPANDNNFVIEILGNKGANRLSKEEVKSGYDHLCFNVADLDKTIEELKNRNIEIIRSFSVPAIGKRCAFISDPFGNSIEFCDDIK